MPIRVGQDKPLRVQLSEGLFVRDGNLMVLSRLDKVVIRRKDIIPGGERLKVTAPAIVGSRVVLPGGAGPLDLDYVLLTTDSGIGNNFVHAVNIENAEHGNLSGLEGTSDDLLGIDYDSEGQVGFVANEAEGAIKRFTFTQDTQILFSADNVTSFITGEDSPNEVFGIAVDNMNGYLWWSIQGDSSGKGTLRRANLSDGTGKTSVFTSAVRMRGLAYDPVNNLMYFAGGAGGVGEIWQINITAGTEQKITNAENRSFMAIGPDYEYVFHGRLIGGQEKLTRTKVSNGSQITLDTTSSVTGVAVTDQGKVYWVQSNGVHRCDFDLTNEEHFYDAGSGGLQSRDLCPVYDHVSEAA